MKSWGIPGGSVALTKNGKLVYNRGFGYSDHHHLRPAQPDDQYRIASVSKPITSIAIMKLVEEGKLHLTDKVFGKGKILESPYYLNAISDPRVYDITVQNLLEHTAGWDRDASFRGIAHFDPPLNPLVVTDFEQAPNPVGDSTLIRFSLHTGLHHDPGSFYSYSNVGYLILGKVIAAVSGMPYETYVQKVIFEPLSIHSIELGKNHLKDRKENESEYFSDDKTESCYGNSKSVPSQYGGFNVEAMNAHGGWIASAPDLTKLIVAVDGFDSSPDLLSNKSLKEMSAGSTINPYYAKGWSVNPKRNNWYHTGSLEGTAAFICRTESGYTWAFLFNARGDNSEAFWNSFDRLPGECIKTISKFPETDLYLTRP
jgi:CubicO group peptidase (beta-lactamase class C family)